MRLVFERNNIIAESDKVMVLLESLADDVALEVKGLLPFKMTVEMMSHILKSVYGGRGLTNDPNITWQARANELSQDADENEVEYYHRVLKMTQLYTASLPDAAHEAFYSSFSMALVRGHTYKEPLRAARADWEKNKSSRPWPDRGTSGVDLWLQLTSWFVSRRLKSNKRKPEGKVSDHPAKRKGTSSSFEKKTCSEFKESGKCRFGERCRFSHAAKTSARGLKKGGICYRFQAGKCDRGKDSRGKKKHDRDGTYSWTFWSTSYVYANMAQRFLVAANTKPNQGSDRPLRTMSESRSATPGLSSITIHHRGKANGSCSSGSNRGNTQVGRGF
jgi:hypothetical protein